MPDNRIAWSINAQVDSSQDPVVLRTREWGDESTDVMIEGIRTFPVPAGREGLGGKKTMGDLIDKTPRDNISKVFLEEKLFETWSYGRVVLVGDGRTGTCCSFYFFVRLDFFVYDTTDLRLNSHSPLLFLIDSMPQASTSYRTRYFGYSQNTASLSPFHPCSYIVPFSNFHPGAVNAFEDAVIVANCIYDLRSTSRTDIQSAFQEYRDQRYLHAKFQYQSSKSVAKVIQGQVKMYFVFCMHSKSCGVQVG